MARHFNCQNTLEIASKVTSDHRRIKWILGHDFFAHSYVFVNHINNVIDTVFVVIKHLGKVFSRKTACFLNLHVCIKHVESFLFDLVFASSHPNSNIPCEFIGNCVKTLSTLRCVGDWNIILSEFETYKINSSIPGTLPSTTALFDL